MWGEGEGEGEEGGEEEDAEFDPLEYMESMEGAVESLERRLKGISTGRAVPEMLDGIRVDAYGESMPLEHLAQVSAKGANALSISLFDPSLASAVESAVLAANLNLNPIPAQNGLLVPIPKVTAQVRAERLKQVASWAEDARVSIRSVRSSGMKTLKALEKSMPKEYWDIEVRDFEALVKDCMDKVEAVKQGKEDDLSVGE